ncbi:MAG TPA: heme o synthase [Candidatus Aquilonibacter sp.]|jgi:protoheme IX farnesyltransferase|nr:heme o synthase [Candidatus Aquilonibacter sp.]
MSDRPALTDSCSVAKQERHFGGSSLLSDYWALTKPEVNFLILITTFVGFYLASASVGWFSFAGLFNTLLGTLLVASGTGALNQYVERKFDAQMRRTAQRPAAAGRLTPSAVLAFGTALAVTGSIYLATAVNLLASLLATLTLLTYLFAYTPLKRKTPMCVLVGAFPGAMPPLIGWAAASGRLNVEAGILYAMLFLWQFPHFMAIAWMYREDYDRAGYFVLPKGNARVPFVMLETLLPLLALVSISIMQSPTRHSLIFYCVAVLLGEGFLYCGLDFVVQRSRVSARRLLTASIVYLPLLYALSATLCNWAR